MKHSRQFLFFIIIYLIHGNKLKIGGPILVHGWSCDWFTGCCKSNCCSSSSGTDSDKKKSSNSSDGSTFEIDVNGENKALYGKNYSFQKGSGIKLYTINKNKKCSNVKFGDKDVWKYDTGDYPEKVRYINNDKKIYIHFPNNVVKTFKQNNDNWEEETQGSEGDGKKGAQGSNGTQKANQPTSGGTTPANQTSGGTTGTTPAGGGGGNQQSTPATQ